MMTLMRFALLLGLVLGYGTANASKDSFWINPEIPKLVQWPHALTMPRPPLNVSSRMRLNTCSAYLAAKPRWNVEKSELVMSQYNVYDYFICEALGWAKVKEIAGVEDRDQFGKALCEQLDINSFSNSHTAELDPDTNPDEPGVTLKEAGMGVSQSIGNRCQISDDETYFVMHAMLHVTDPATQKRLLWVWITDDLLGGSYRSRFTQWFEWSPKVQRWKAIKVPPKPAVILK